MIVSDNVLLKGGRGTFGRQFVLRQRNGKTVMYKMPKPYPPKTANQLTNQERFAKANLFAKAAIADPVKKQYYQAMAKPGQSAYNVAFREAFHGPEITAVSLKDKTVRVKDNYIADRVIVNNEAAVFNTKRGIWVYVTSEKVLRVQVYDRYGHVFTISPT